MKKLIITSLFFVATTLSLQAQTVGKAVKVPTFSSYGEPMWLQLPQGYTTSIKYPLLIFIHGVGEASPHAWNDPIYMNGDDLYKIYTSTTAGGPSYFREQGWNGKAYNPVTLDSTSFIIISPQATGSGWFKATDIKYFLKYMAANYSVDTNRIYFTGLSAGGSAEVGYLIGTHDVTKADKPYLPAAWVPMSEAYGTSYQWMADSIMHDSIPAWGFGDASGADVHGKNTKDLMDEMNNDVAGYTRFTQYSGGHCCWANFYIPSYTSTIWGGNAMSIYSWMLTKSRTPQAPTPQPPTVNAGTDQTLSASATSTSLTATATPYSGTTITGYSWTQVSGSSATIVSSTSATTSITGLTTGVYVFRMTVTQSDSKTAFDDVQVTIPSSPAPTVNAGTDQNITLTATTVTGTATAGSGATITSTLWTQISGTAATITSPSNLSTTITNLSNGTNVFRLTATQSDGQSTSDDIQVIVNADTGSCGCTYTLDPATPDSATYWKSKAATVAPGSVICLKAGRFNHLNFDGLKGTRENPIIIKNCGGLVTISSGFTYMFRVVNSSWVTVDGSGDPNVFYGIQTKAWNGTLTKAPFSFNGHLTGIKINNVWGDSTTAWGLQIKTTPSDFDSLTWAPYGTIHDVVVRDTKMTNTGSEGYYIGQTDDNNPVKTVTTAGDTITINVDGVQIDTLNFYNNIAMNTQWDGMQISAAKSFVVHDNFIKNYGIENTSSQMDGFVLGGKSYGVFYRNIIDSGNSTGIHLMGYNNGVPPTLIYNNLVINSGWDGINVDDRPNVNKYLNQKYYILNNTIVHPARYGAIFDNSGGTVAPGNKFNNNIIAGAVNTPVVFGSSILPSYVDTTNNAIFSTVAAANFVGGGDYHLQSSSQAFNKTGYNQSAIFLDDLDKNSRNGAYGVGAYRTFIPSIVPVIIRQFLILKGKMIFK